MNGAEPTWVAAEQPPVPEPSPPNGDRVSNPTAAVKEEDGKTRLTCLFAPLCFYLHPKSESKPGGIATVQIGVMQETACLVLSGLIQTNPLLQGSGNHHSPNPLCTPLSQGSELREVGQRPTLTFTD